MTPLEVIEYLVLRPFTLSVRLFADTFAGHFILMVFALGGCVLYGSSTLLYRPLSLLSWAMAIAAAFLELLVAVLQAYVFAMLNSFYIQTSLSDEH
ncbi:hypothetical protein GCM10023322_77020 [Rugosimonospora acidiphila]|uniref:ATP synthase subunit a n=2 Tax=Rugosimonospora acidiphila TaxID=556531 RepID=A0ABP9SRN6_9ACTN